MRGMKMFGRWRPLLLVGSVLLAALAAGCNNSPYPAGAERSNTLFYSFDERSPRYLDPTASYANPESAYTFQIYEPPYGYHYLKRPYVLVPKAASSVVKPHYLDKDGKPLADDAPAALIAESVYDVPITPGIKYQPHPAFAQNDKGEYLYHHLTRAQLGDKRSPLAFEQQGTRELVADDFVYALKRHATTRIEAPVFAVFADYVLGLKDYAEQIKKEDAKLLAGLPDDVRDKPFLDFRKFPLAGTSAPDKYTWRIRLKGKYPQWSYWMAMPFLAPVPWEADAFYAQDGMSENGLSLNQWPVGTGPFMMVDFVRDRRHVLKRNPNYRGEAYPCEGMPGDKEAGLLDDCGKTMPFVDTLYVTIEKEKVPRKEKFKQGYLDVPEIERPEWGVDFRNDADDSDRVKKLFDERGFKFPLMTDISDWYLGFNMLDPVVGRGDTPAQQAKNRKLRQALSIAIDWEEWSKVFPEDAGSAAMSPLPPGIFGSREETPEGLNPVTHRRVGDLFVRRPIEDAKRLLAEAGYPNGRDAKTGKPLVLNYDYYAAPTPENKPKIEWVVRQFAKIDVQLEVRATDNNQFQDKVRKGKYQVFWLGWNADYPDAENFLFLLTTAAGKTKFDGENTSNYSNPAFDRLFDQMKVLEDGPAKQKLIDQMVTIAREDAPWTMGFYPYASAAVQHWVYNSKSAVLVRDQARYLRIDPKERVARMATWNQAIWWPMGLGVLAVLAVWWLGRRNLKLRERTNARGEILAR